VKLVKASILPAVLVGAFAVAVHDMADTPVSQELSNLGL